MAENTLYELLGVPDDATAGQIEPAHRRVRTRTRCSGLLQRGKRDALRCRLESHSMLGMKVDGCASDQFAVFAECGPAPW